MHACKSIRAHACMLCVVAEAGHLGLFFLTARVCRTLADSIRGAFFCGKVVVPNSDVSFVSPAAAQSAAASKPTSDHSTVGHAMNIHASTSTVQYDSGNRQLSPKVTLMPTPKSIPPA